MRSENLLALVLLFSGCAHVPNTTACAAKGTMLAGANCAETNTGKMSEIDFAAFVEMLEARPERPDPLDPTKTLPAHGAAICQSSSDWNALKTALEQACRLLGNRCTYEMEQSLLRTEEILSRLSPLP